MMLSPGAGPLPQVPAQQPTNLFRYGEIGLWSTFLFSAGTVLANTQNRIFSTALGGQGQGFTRSLTISETSLKESGRIPSGQAYDVYGIATQIIPVVNSTGKWNGTFADSALSASTLQNFVSCGVLSFDFTQTRIVQCPIMMAGAGGGVYGTVATADAATPTTFGALNNGNGGIYAMRKNPVSLPGSTTFSMLIEFGEGAATMPAQQQDDLAVACRVVLLGAYRSVIEVG